MKKTILIALILLPLLTLTFPALASEEYVSDPLGLTFQIPESYAPYEQDYPDDNAYGVALMSPDTPLTYFLLRKEAPQFADLALPDATDEDIAALLEALLLPADAFDVNLAVDDLTGSATLTAVATSGSEYHLLYLHGGGLYDFALLNLQDQLDLSAITSFMQLMQTVRFHPEG